ncbi:hypothetical protein C8Q75DRAFT_736341 [Abortiporus biennis]|nr:hypothetical protein C8Q75DRAFT_736341 [Abortiporus biennis]
MSFSSPQPTKSSRPSLRRTGSYLSLADMQTTDSPFTQRQSSNISSFPTVDYSKPIPYSRPLRHMKEQRDRRRSHTRSFADTTIVIQTHTNPTPPPPKPQPFPRQRTTSPLSPTVATLPARASFPKSKPEPDLYKVAITTRMRMSPEGQKILHMGPRLALSISAATQELERIVAAAQRDKDNDVVMINAEPHMTTSWVMVPPEDWEMVDCSA